MAGAPVLRTVAPAYYFYAMLLPSITDTAFAFEVRQMQINFGRLRVAIDAGLYEPYYHISIAKWLDRIIYLKRQPDFGISHEVLCNLQRLLIDYYLQVLEKRRA